MGFGDGEKFIPFLVDFDGAVSNSGSSGKMRYGLLVYPACGGSLKAGSVSDILSNSKQYDSNSRHAVLDALTLGTRNRFQVFGGSRHDNGNSWPGTFRECFVLNFTKKLHSVRFVSALQ